MNKEDKIKIYVFSINRLLHIPNLKNSFEKAILFISTKPNYYDFGHTTFLKLDLVDSDEIEIPFGMKHKFLGFVLDCFSKKEVYICCDAGLSRSPAFAYVLAKKLGKHKLAKEIKDTFQFMNVSIRKQLLGDL